MVVFGFKERPRRFFWRPATPATLRPCKPGGRRGEISERGGGALLEGGNRSTPSRTAIGRRLSFSNLSRVSRNPGRASRIRVGFREVGAEQQGAESLRLLGTREQPLGGAGLRVALGGRLGGRGRLDAAAVTVT